jgi:hypothetical protein
LFTGRLVAEYIVSEEVGADLLVDVHDVDIGVLVVGSPFFKKAANLFVQVFDERLFGFKVTDIVPIRGNVKVAQDGIGGSGGHLFEREEGQSCFEMLKTR